VVSGLRFVLGSSLGFFGAPVVSGDQVVMARLWVSFGAMFFREPNVVLGSSLGFFLGANVVSGTNVVLALPWFPFGAKVVSGPMVCWALSLGSWWPTLFRDHVVLGSLPLLSLVPM